jgi:uncharacterized protein YcgI (DUF1989 family)
VSETVIIEPKSGAAVMVKRGQILRIQAIDSGQVADLVCFSENDHKERFSQSKTRVRNWSTHISTGSELISTRDNVMFTIVADTVGVHDIVFSPCHSWVYEHMFEVGPRNGCFENLAAAVESFGISADELPGPFNIFMNTGIKDDGELSVSATTSRQGDYLDMRAEMDCLVAVSACADDVTDCNLGECTRIGLHVT